MPANSFLLIVLGFLALLVVNLLIAVVEGVALTLLSWNPFRPSMTASVIMNMVSGLFNAILLILLQHTPLVWIPISFVLSIIIETFILTYFKRGAFRQNLLRILIVNLASNVLLILPAYYFGKPPG